MKKVTDYIVDFLSAKGIRHFFGYPGGVVCHLMDSVRKREHDIKLNFNYHEQSCAFAACAYAQANNAVGAAFATSGPGATNLITGIANAWYDSTPVLFFTGQVDTYALKENLQIRQKGFQETDIISIVAPITKYCIQITDPSQIKYELEKTYHLATTGRKGPVLIDLPADVQRAVVDIEALSGFVPSLSLTKNEIEFVNLLQNAKRPVVIAGAGINQSNLRIALRKFIEKWQIPVVTSMPAYDLLEYDHPLHMGFLGVNGHRYANISLAKSDCIICLGSRLDLKQIGLKRNLFSSNTLLIRIDIDEGELDYRVNQNEVGIHADVEDVLATLNNTHVTFESRDPSWSNVCQEIKKSLEFVNDTQEAHSYLREFSRRFAPHFSYTLDVGQNEVWAAQALELKQGQRLLMSAGLGTMGYALPAAIGAYYATQKPQVCIVGDGGLQMNIQELQCVAANNLPITILLMNNKSLGMIRHFQEKFFESKYISTTQDSGYSIPNFQKVFDGYGIPYTPVKSLEDIDSLNLGKLAPQVYDIFLSETTYLGPGFGRENLYDQEPQICRDLFNKIMIL